MIPKRFRNIAIVFTLSAGIEPTRCDAKNVASSGLVWSFFGIPSELHCSPRKDRSRYDIQSYRPRGMGACTRCENQVQRRLPHERRIPCFSNVTELLRLRILV